jgi:hypothetical protein
MYFRSDRLAQSLAGNPLHLLTITATGTTEEIRSRPIVLLMARVHPGESNASWIMHGKFFLSEDCFRTLGNFMFCDGYPSFCKYFGRE